MKYLLILFFTIATHVLHAQKIYEFNSTCQMAYKEIVQLKLNNAQALINKAKQQNANNLIPLVLESYVDFFTLFFNEDPEEFKVRLPKFEERIKQLNDGQSKLTILSLLFGCCVFT
ncbi:MAG: hypothetical protein V9E96_07125 [Chitinophagaceae bacterium]